MSIRVRITGKKKKEETHYTFPGCLITIIFLYFLPSSSLCPFVPAESFNSVTVALSDSSSFCRAGTDSSSLFILSFSFWRTGRDAISFFNLLFSFSTSSKRSCSFAPSAACPLATFSSSLCAWLKKRKREKKRAREVGPVRILHSQWHVYAQTHIHVYTACTRWNEVTPEVELVAQKSAGSLWLTYLEALCCQHLLGVGEPRDWATPVNKNAHTVLHNGKIFDDFSELSLPDRVVKKWENGTCRWDEGEHKSRVAQLVDNSSNSASVVGGLLLSISH